MPTELPPTDEPERPAEPAPRSEKIVIPDEHLAVIREQNDDGRYVLSLDEVRKLPGLSGVSKATLSRIRTKGQNSYWPTYFERPCTWRTKRVTAAQAVTVEAARRVLWYSRHPMLDSQAGALRQLYGAPTVIEQPQMPGNAQALVEHFQGSSADDCVIVGPLAYLEHVLGAGVRPLWAQMEECSPDDPRIEVRAGRKGYRFHEFRRLTGLSIEYAPVLKALAHSRPAVVAWLSRHLPRPDAQEQLRQLYGEDVNIRRDQRAFVDANEIAVSRTGPIHDLVLVAPLSVYDDLAQRRVYPIRATIEHDRTILRRVLAVRKEFAPAEPLPPPAR